MENVDYLIIGGGIAGTSAAETIRKLDASGSIAIVSDEPHRLYSRLTLSKPDFFLGKIPVSQLWLKPPEWYAQNRIQLVANKSAVQLDSGQQTVRLDDGATRRYHKLLLAIGGKSCRCEVPGSTAAGIQYLRTLDDAQAIIRRLKTATRAACLGGGFISFEMCELFTRAGLSVSMVFREPYYWGSLLDEPSGRMVERAMERAGVALHRNTLITAFLGMRQVTGLQLQDGTDIAADLVVPGIGAYTPLEWLRTTGINLNRGILTDEYFATNLNNVWAAGDCAEFRDLILDEQVQLGNWVNAQQQGKIAGLNMAGQKQPFRMVSFYTTRGFGITIAFCGDVRANGRQVIARGSPEANSYARLIVDDHDELVGATFINRTHDLGFVSRLIAQNVNVAPIRDRLADAHCNLALLNQP